MSYKRTYNADDVRRYLEGKLTPAEMHALEKAALDDPFLSDALEGMKGYGNAATFANDVDDLKERLNKRTGLSRKQVVNAGLLWKVAAVLVIVITGVAVILFMGEKNNDSTSQLATTQKQESPVPEPDSAKADTVAVATTTDSAATQASTTNETDVATVTPRRPKRRAVSRPVPAEESKLEESAQVQSLSELEAPPAAKKADAAAPSTAAANPSSQSDTTFDEVVVVGSGAVNKQFAGSRAVTVKRKNPNVLPSIGWDGFEKYLNDSFESATLDSTLNGEERITFSIDENGSPEAIKILKSLSPAHDREAIRLLREGPAWKVPKGGTKNITLKLIF